MVSGMEAVQYAGACARVRGMRSNLLSDDLWQAIVLAESLPEAVAVLARSDYARLFSGPAVAEGRLDLERVERALLGRAAGDCRRAMSMLHGDAQRMVQIWWQHYEMDNLKAVFRGVQRGIAPQRISEYLIPLEGHSRLPWQALLHERTINGLVDRLRDSRYINPLLNAYPSYQRDDSIFYLEVALDVRYYRDIAVGIGRLGRSDQVQARSVLGTHVDILNLLWAYRYRIYYGLSVEEIVNYTIWHTFRTDVDLVRDIALGASPVDVVTRLWGPNAIDAAELAAIEDQQRMLPRLELMLKRYWRRLAVRQMQGYPFGLGLILGYLVVAELEVDDLVSVLESKRLGWAPERIRDHLIRGEE